MAASILESRETLTSRLENQLGTLVTSVMIASRNNLPSTNVVAETTWAGLLNRVYGWELINANAIKQNYPGADLVDADRSIAIQVTATCTVEKVRHTLEEVAKSGMLYKKLVILTITTAHPTPAMLNCTVPGYTGPVEIWNIPDVFRDAKELDLIILDDLTKYMEAALVPARDTMLLGIQRNLFFLSSEIQASKYRKHSDIESDFEVIFCELLNKVYDLHLENANMVLPNYPCVDFLDQKNGVALELTVDNTFAKIKQTQAKFEKQRLSKSYRQLWFLILGVDSVSSRIHEFRPSEYELKIMDLSMLYEEITKLPTKKILEVHTYLYETIGFRDGDAEEAVAASIDKKAVSPTQQQILALASLLPPSGLESCVFSHGLTIPQRKALSELVSRNYLLQKDTTLRLHPNIRSEYSKKLRADVDYDYFLEQLWHYDRSWHWDRVTVQDRKNARYSLAQIFASAAKLLEDPGSVNARRSAELWMDVHEYRRALNMGRNVLHYCVTGKSSDWDWARASDFVGNCHNELGEYGHAHDAWEKTLSLCRGSLHASPSDLATALHKVGCSYLALDAPVKAKACLMEELKIRERLRRTHQAVADQPGLKEMYEELGTAFWKLGQGHEGRLCSANALRAPSEMEDLLLGLTPHLDLPLTSELPLDGFVGREAELREIKARFSSGDRVVILSGLGGMGKTELAVQYGRENPGLSYFVRFDTSFSRTLANMAWSIRPKLHEEELRLEESILTKKVLLILEQSNPDDLLIIDNVDSDTGTLTVLMQDPNFKHLLRLPLRLLITTRFDVPQAIHIMPMSEEVLFAIFRNHKAEVSESEMRALIQAVSGHTLTIDLIARTLNRNSWRKVTPEKLLSSLRNNDWKGLKHRKIATHFNSSTEYAQIDQHLTTVFNISGISDVCRRVLAYATLLPDDGMDGECFGLSLQVEEQVALDTLLKHSWLKMEDSLLTIHPVVRLVCQTELEITEADCEAFLDRLWIQYDPAMYRPDHYRQMAELFTFAHDRLAPSHCLWLNRSGILLDMLAEYQKLHDLYHTRLATLEATLPPNSTELATVYTYYGISLDALGHYSSALTYCHKALAILQLELPEDSYDLARSYNNVGNVYSSLGDHHRALEYTLQALSIMKKILPPEHPDLATAYNNTGTTYNNLGDHHKALEYQQTALEIRKKVLPPEHPVLADSYNQVGATYLHLGNYSKGLEYQLQALAIQERVLPPEHPDLAGSYHSIGIIYADLGEHRKSLDYQQKALMIRERALPSNHPNLAHTFSNIAWTYHELGILQEAAQSMRRAADIIAHADLPKTHPSLTNYPKWAAELEKKAEIQQKLLAQPMDQVPGLTPFRILPQNNKSNR